MERVAGIEPALQAWEAGALPLHHTRRVDVDTLENMEVQGASSLPLPPRREVASTRGAADRSQRRGRFKRAHRPTNAVGCSSRTQNIVSILTFVTICLKVTTKKGGT